MLTSKHMVTFQICTLCFYVQTYTFIYSCKLFVISINMVTNIVAHKHTHTDLEAHNFTHLRETVTFTHTWLWMTLFQYTVDPCMTRISTVGPLICKFFSINIQLALCVYGFWIHRFNQLHITFYTDDPQLVESEDADYRDREGRLWDLDTLRFWYTQWVLESVFCG